MLDISVVIPFKDKSSLTLGAVLSFLKFGPTVREFLLVSNNSSPSELGKIRSAVYAIKNVKILEYNKPFNYHKMNNWAIRKASGKFILMMNNDIEFSKNSLDIIERMLKKASEKNVGVCGCTLLYSNQSRIQHAGVFLCPGGMAEHMYIGKSYKKALRNAGSGMFPYSIKRDLMVSAVTGAFQLVEKSKFDAINGMNESFIIGGGDVDLCIRMNKKGYQTWFIGGGYLIHKESASRRHIPLPFSDFYNSYLSYIKSYNIAVGDPFLPKITTNMKSSFGGYDEC